MLSLLILQAIKIYKKALLVTGDNTREKLLLRRTLQRSEQLSTSLPPHSPAGGWTTDKT